MPFDDVPTTQPFYHDIEAVAAVGIARGTSASPPVFSPDATTTVGEFDSWLMRAVHWKDPTKAESDTVLPALTVDVPETHQFFGQVQRAVKVGIHGGPERPDYSPGYVEGGGGPGLNTHSLAFDGTGAYVSVGKAGLDGATDWTVAAWVKAPASGAPQAAFAATNDVDPTGQSSLVLQINGAGSHRVLIEVQYVGESGTQYAFSPDSITDNTWHHICGRRSGSQLTLFVDGVARMTVAVNPVAMAIASAYVGIYRVATTGTRPWSGNIDKVNVYTRALTDGEVADLKAGRDVATTNHVGDWEFEEGTGTTTADTGSGGNNGTLTGGGVTWSTDVPTTTGGLGAVPPTRGLACVFIVRALGLEPLTDVTGRFSDVAAGHKFRAYIEKAAALGIVGVTGAAAFNPDDNLTRDRMACFIRRGFAVPFVTTPGNPVAE